MIPLPDILTLLADIKARTSAATPGPLFVHETTAMGETWWNTGTTFEPIWARSSGGNNNVTRTQ